MNNKITCNPWGQFIVCLFLGLFGVHKFIDKKIGMGLLYLFTAGLLGIGWIVDLVKYLLVALKIPGKSRGQSSQPRNATEEHISTSLRLKRIALWVLSIIWGLSALVCLSSGVILASLFATLFVALILPSDSWQTRVKKYLSGRLKSLLAVVLAALCIFSAPSPETPNSELNNPSLIATENSTESIEESVVPPFDNATESSTKSPTTETPAAQPSIMEAPTDASSEPTTSPTTIPTTELNATPTSSSFSIHFIDVGQADAALVECDGHYMLIDGGNKSDSNVIYSVLKNTGVPKLDIVVGTHAHEDHIGGIPGAFNYTTADLTLCPVTSYDTNAFRDFARYAEQNGNGITIPSIGDTYPLGSATIKILGVNGGVDTNDSSIVLRIDYGQTSFLFTGDAERTAEQAILSSGANLSATVLKVGHHGSDTSTTYPFLREIMPQYAIISVGQDNSYGHPTENTLSRLRDADVTVFRTDMQGDIYCVSDGQHVTITPSRNADADVLSSLTQTQSSSKQPVAAPSKETEEPSKSDQDYVANTNTKKFHYPRCSSAEKIKPSNRWDFHGARDELINRGYVPCKNCNP